MPKFIPLVPKPLDGELHWPAVRLVLRDHQGLETPFEFRKASLVVGTSAECDVCIHDSALPPILAVLTQCRQQLHFRSLVKEVTFNHLGKPFIEGLLQASAELQFHGYTLQVKTLSGRLPQARQLAVHIDDAAKDSSSTVSHEQERQQLEMEKQLLFHERQQLVDERRDWELDAEKQAESLALRTRQVMDKENALLKQEEELARLAKTLQERLTTIQENDSSQQPLKKLPTEAHRHLEMSRQALDQMRNELYERYRKRRDQLVAQQAAVDHAARKVQAEKRTLEEAKAAFELSKSSWEKQCAEWQEKQTDLSRQHQLIAEWQKELEQEHDALLEQVRDRTRHLEQQQIELAKSQSTHKDDLVRLERFHATLLVRQQKLDEAEQQLNQRQQALLEQSEELAAQAEECQQWHARLQSEQTRVSELQAKVLSEQKQLEDKAQQLFIQQQQVSQLWNRAERIEADVRLREQQLTQERLRVDQAEQSLHEATRQIHQDRQQWLDDRQRWESEKAQLSEQQIALQKEVERLQQVERNLQLAQEQVKTKQAHLDAVTIEMAQTSQLMRLRAVRLQRWRHKLMKQNRFLHEQADLISQTDHARESLQEQLRMRSAQLAQREQALQNAENEWQTKLAEWQLQHSQWQAERESEKALLLQQRNDLTMQKQTLELRLVELSQWDQTNKDQAEHLAEEQRKLAALMQQIQQKAHSVDQQSMAWEQQRNTWQQQLPGLLQQARIAVQQLAQARERLRTHLQEVHTYVAKCQNDLSQWQSQLSERGLQIHSAQDRLTKIHSEHRLEISQFKLFLSEWQEHLHAFRQSIAQDQSSLQERESQLAEEASRLQRSHNELDLRSGRVQELEEAIQTRRTSLNRHLHDLQSWYRLKIQELAEKHLSHESRQPASTEPTILRWPASTPTSDARLVEQLLQLELLDVKTIEQLQQDAKRKQTSLKRWLLDAEILTAYQLQMIEMDRLEGLAIGPIRIIDRLRELPFETIYRVFDSKRGSEAILRHLHADVDNDRAAEFRQGFERALAVQHRHVACTYEIVEFENRPAALQEWVMGLPSTEWCKWASPMSLWLHLACQAVAALQAIHQQGLIHGHLHAGRVLLAPHGDLKLCGLGEPAWLIQSIPAQDPTQEQDLRALGKILRSWSPNISKAPGWRPSRDVLFSLVQGLTSPNLTAPYHSAESLADYLETERTKHPLDDDAWQAFLDRLYDALSITESDAQEEANQGKRRTA